MSVWVALAVIGFIVGVVGAVALFRMVTSRPINGSGVAPGTPEQQNAVVVLTTAATSVASNGSD
jgi:hypothetical protein